MWRANAWAPFIIAPYPGKPDNSLDDTAPGYMRLHLTQLSHSLSFILIIILWFVAVKASSTVVYTWQILEDLLVGILYVEEGPVYHKSRTPNTSTGKIWSCQATDEKSGRICSEAVGCNHKHLIEQYCILSTKLVHGRSASEVHQILSIPVCLNCCSSGV